MPIPEGRRRRLVRTIRVLPTQGRFFCNDSEVRSNPLLHTKNGPGWLSLLRREKRGRVQHAEGAKPSDFGPRQYSRHLW